MSVGGTPSETDVQADAVRKLCSETTLKILLQLVGNAADNPCEPKFHGPVRKSNRRISEYVVDVTGAAAVLCLAGFVEESDHFALQPPIDVERLQSIRSLLQQRYDSISSTISPTPSEGQDCLASPTPKRKPFVPVARRQKAPKYLISTATQVNSVQQDTSHAASNDSARMQPGSLRVRFRLPVGGRMDFVFDESDTVAAMKSLILERTGIKPHHQRYKLGYPPKTLRAEAAELLIDVGIRDGEVMILENLHDLFLGDLESCIYTMEELLQRLPPDDDAAVCSTGADFRDALQAFDVHLDARNFWDVVVERLRKFLIGDIYDAAEVERLCAGFVLLRKFFQNHDPRERLAMMTRCLPLPRRGLFRPEILVDRMSFFQSIAAQILNMSQAQLLSNVIIHYRGEVGIDAGGLTRDFFSNFATRLGEDETKMWQFTSRGSLQPTPDMISKDAQAPSLYGWTTLRSDDLYCACGRVFGMAVVHGCKLGCPLSRPFVRLLIGDPPRGVEELQAELNYELRDGEHDFRGSPKFLEQPLVDSGLSGTLTFTHGISNRPDLKEIELVPGGADIEVTDDNKRSWLELSLRHELVTSVEAAAAAFKRGLIDVLGGSNDCCPLLCLLEAEELIELWGKRGVTRQEVVYWRQVSQFSPVVETQASWFWEVLENDFDDDLRGKVLQFATGSGSIGRHGLRGGFLIEVADGGDERLPMAQTCGNMIMLPRYSARWVLAARLQTAAECCSSFAML